MDRHLVASDRDVINADGRRRVRFQREDNTKFWDKLREVGRTHHQNQYADFEVIESICKEEMQALGYI